MFVVEIVCSDPRCEVEEVVWVEEPGEADLVACECGHGMVAVRVEGAEPLLAAAV
jgi:hypothetical protein